VVVVLVHQMYLQMVLLVLLIQAVAQVVQITLQDKRVAQA
jgi:hypothetical protein